MLQLEPSPEGDFGYSTKKVVTNQPKKNIRFIRRNLLPASGLDDVEEIILEQKIRKEMCSDNFNFNTEFAILNVYRQPLLTTMEDSDFCIRSIWGRLRPINVYVKNLNDELVFYVHRKHNCCRCGCHCIIKYCEESMTVEMNDTVVGYVASDRLLGKPTYSILDDKGSILYSIVGKRFPTCTKCCLGADISFQIKQRHKTVGEIVKHRIILIPDPGYERPYARVKFPEEATLIDKVLLLAAAFHIEVHYFDEDPLTFMQN